MKAVRAIVTGLLIVLAVVFVVQNGQLMFQKVTFRLNLIVLSFQTYPLPLYAHLLIVFLLGVLLALSFYLFAVLNFSKTTREKTREILRLNEELASIRGPVAAEAEEEESGAEEEEKSE